MLLGTVDMDTVGPIPAVPVEGVPLLAAAEGAEPEPSAAEEGGALLTTCITLPSTSATIMLSYCKQ